MAQLRAHLVREWPASAGTLAQASDLLRRRELFRTLLQRDVKARYTQSVLGLYWALVHPLTMALVFTVAFSIIARVAVEGAPYFLFVLCGLMVWNFFSHSLADATETLLRNTNLVTKVPFPKEVLPLTSVAARLVDFLFALLVVFAIVLIVDPRFSWTFLWVPLLLGIQVIFVLGMGPPRLRRQRLLPGRQAPRRRGAAAVDVPHAHHLSAEPGP